MLFITHLYSPAQNEVVVMKSVSRTLNCRTWTCKKSETAGHHRYIHQNVSFHLYLRQ